MRYATSLAVVVTALTLVGAANAATQSSQPAKTASKAAEPAKAAPAAKVTGTLQKYDASTNTVVVKVGTKEESFVLGPGAELRLGAQTLAAADLSQHVGQQVAVHYGVQGGAKTCSRLVVAEHAAKPAKPVK